MLSKRMSTETDTPLSRAKAIAGGAAGLAEKLSKLAPERGLTPQAITQWKKVPATRVADVSGITGIPAHELRPDVFPAPMAVAS